MEDRDAGDTHVGARGPFFSRRSSRAIENGVGDLNARWTSPRLAAGLQRESIMENLPSPSRPSSPLPSIHGIFDAENVGIIFGGRPSLTGANTQPAERAQTPMIPSKLGKRKSLGFVRLEFGGGTSEEEPTNARKYPTLRLGFGQRAVDSDEGDHGDQQQ